jgi:hypothetical protein
VLFFIMAYTATSEVVDTPVLFDTSGANNETV